MRAVLVSRFGGPEVLAPTTLPDPVPGPGQVVVAAAAVDVLNVETSIRAGRATAYFSVRPPYVPGGGIAGTVRAIGSGVSPSWTGRRVVTRLADWGGYAELGLASAADLVPVPDGLGLLEAAALVHDGPTALGIVRATNPFPGEWVLVLPAVGGAGSLLVQLAVQAGARVVGAARGVRKLALARGLGAEAVVDYSDPDWVDQVGVMTGAGPDVVLDGVGGKTGRMAFEVAAEGGRFSAHGAPGGAFAPVEQVEADRRGITLRGIADVQFPPAEAKRLLQQAVRDAAVGRLRPVIGQTFPLENAAEAHTAIEDRRVLGKTLLLV
ncbi:zinc-binding dehydrogenase [Micromonospora sp. CPCC 206060]|uniref:zinc-binding dehydrogenase n=1 Tax=Micromonospora sp. CPCC 206060 TaxID=3122406 RepID=UPI002FF29120